MGKWMGWVLAMTIASGGMAQASLADGQTAAVANLSGWEAVQHLKAGTGVVVEELSTPGDYHYQAPCKLVSVDGASLTCRMVGRRGQRVVYPSRQVLAVYRVKMRVTVGSWARIVLFAGGGFLVGCAITDENPDYPLGAMGAIGGAAAGAARISREPKLVVVYRRMETPVEVPGEP